MPRKAKKKQSDPYKPKTDEEIKKLALEMFRGNIVTDRHITQSGQDPSILITLFLPLALGGPDLGKWMEENEIDLIYGKMSETIGDRSLNGWPMFTMAHLLNKNDAQRLFERYEKIQEAMKSIE